MNYIQNKIDGVPERKRTEAGVGQVAYLPTRQSGYHRSVESHSVTLKAGSVHHKADKG